MGERTTRFDSMVEQEEKKKSDKKINPFEKSNQNLKRASDNKTQDMQDDAGMRNMEAKVVQENIKKDSENLQDKEKDSVSKRLNISDIINDTKRVKKRGGRSRTFYMQDAMYDKLASVAEKQGIKPSQLLHIILDNVLEKM